MPTKQKDESKKGTWSDNLLDTQQLKDFNFVKQRIEQLKKTRQNVYGTNLEELWKDADKDYIPHKLSTKGRRVIVTDELKGLRGQVTELNKSDSWRSDISQPNPYVKLNIALAILIDRNPTGIFTAGSARFENTTNLFKQLYQRSWEIAKSKQQLKLFTYNLAKYGWACARTYPLLLKRKTKKLTEYNQEEPSKSQWEDVDSIEYNDVFRENLDPFNVWIDDMAKPNNPFTLRDWSWRKVYSWDIAEEEFGGYENWKYVNTGGNTQERVGIGATNKKYQEQNLVEVYFYENRLKDLFMVLVNGVPVVIEPLPISDNAGNKKLSCWQTYWTLRHAESPYGIGIYEAIRYDQVSLDTIRNMTIDQLKLAIYKMFFHSGTGVLTETGNIKIEPGIGKQMTDPKSMNWLEVPGPGAESWKGIEMFKNDLNESSGITEPLMGTIVGKTAFELAQAKEAALKRLKGPLDNISEALEDEGYISVSLFQLLYSIPEVYEIAEPTKIEAYINEIKSDPDLYEDVNDEETGERKAIKAKVYREFPLNLEADEKGNLQETEKTQFFRAKPGLLKWEGVIKIKGQSVLTPSKQLDKALDLEMTNITIPLMGQVNQEKQMAQMTQQPFNLDDSTYGKTLKQILKMYEKDPQEWLPNSWLEQPQPEEQPLIVSQDNMLSLGNINPAEALLSPMLGAEQGQLEAEKLVPGGVRLNEKPQGIGGKIIGKLAQTFRRV